MTLPTRILKRSFVPSQPEPEAGQMPGPDGAPAGAGAGPAAGAMPMDPAAAGGMPVDPAAAAGGAPVDPAATGAPAEQAAAADPAAQAAAGNPGAQPAPAAPAVDPATGQPAPAGQEPDKPIDPNAAVNHGQARVVMDIVERTLTAVGKNKKNAPPAGAGGAPGAPGAPGAGGAPDPSQAPGPITGLPGDMSQFAGPIKTGAAIVDLLLDP